MDSTTVSSSTTPGASGHPLGIGLTFTASTTQQSRENEVAKPSDTLIFADAGELVTPIPADPDRWLEKPLASAVYFRPPTDSTYTTTPVRVVARHVGRTPTGFVDGHAESLKPSALGFQYAASNPLALWDRE